MILELHVGKGSAVAQRDEAGEHRVQRIGASRDPRELRPAKANRTAALLLLAGLLLVVALLVAQAVIS